MAGFLLVLGGGGSCREVTAGLIMMHRFLKAEEVTSCWVKGLEQPGTLACRAANKSIHSGMAFTPLHAACFIAVITTAESPRSPALWNLYIRILIHQKHKQLQWQQKQQHSDAAVLEDTAHVPWMIPHIALVKLNNGVALGWGGVDGGWALKQGWSILRMA